MNDLPAPEERVTQLDEPAGAAGSLQRGLPPARRVQPIDEYQGFSPRRRRVVLPTVLFLLTCFTTYSAGACGWQPMLLAPDPYIVGLLKTNWQDGLIFMAAVMSVLMAHEMGHFWMTLRHRVPSSYPFFIPLPVMMIGTMGAVIGMEGSRADRKQLFDIGLAGPLAGLVLAVPLLWYGISIATVDPQPIYGQPLLVKLIAGGLRPDMQANHIRPNPYYMAGWVGMLITGLNMLPISQLDGGHVSHAVLGRRSVLLARGLLLSAMAFVVVQEYYGWTLMLVLVTMLGVDHPPTANDRARIGPLRWTLGLVSLSIPILCFTPFPFVGM